MDNPGSPEPKKAWGGRFITGADKLAEGFTASISFDQRLAEVDIRGSIAHAQMLGHCGIITKTDSATLVEGLESLLVDVQAGRVTWNPADEDIHMNVERRLFERVGDVAGRLHTARSRNDQVATDTRLWLREQLDAMLQEIATFQETLLTLAEEHLEALLPGLTHTQHAQPVLLSHHFMAYFWMLARDYERLAECQKRVNVLPLGAGALAGTPHPIDRHFVAKRLGFDSVAENSMDAVSDRDFAIETTADIALLMMHLSRLANELVLWQSREFSFVMMDDSMTTGSSIMPQKKNPDVAEIVRGKSGRVYGDLVSLLTTMKALPLTYNSDMQEDKERLFDAVDTVRACLAVMNRLLQTSVFRTDRMEAAIRGDYSTATDLADTLAKRGVPFREAHEIVGKLIGQAEQLGKPLENLTEADLKLVSPLLEQDALGCLQPRASAEARLSYGGTATSQVREQLERARSTLDKAWLQTHASKERSVG
ncbi:MAG: argininosuccinate lyase [Armatimonadota bacterium]|nr:argininosuccinate lyase [Armatimonadota bacterium]